jgi:hypothetical protein
VAQAAKGQLQILNAREPIKKVLADPAADAALKKRLETIREARAFASRELALPNNKSYTSYADLKREFVVWSVVATPEFSVTPREWCFPFVGCVAYRGYFRKESAEAFAETNLFQQPRSLLFRAATAGAIQQHRHARVLHDVPRGDEIELLEDEPNVLPAKLRKFTGAHLGKICPEDFDLSAIRVHRAADHAQEGRLPTSARPDDHDHFAAARFEIDAFQGLHGRLSAAE